MVSPVWSKPWTRYPTGDWVLTLRDIPAFVLVSVVVLFITIAGDSIWSILIQLVSRRFVLAERASHDWRHKFYHRVVLTKRSPFIAMLLLCKMLSSRECRRSTLAKVLLAASLVSSLGFLALALMSPWYLTFGTDKNPEVLANKDAGLTRLWVADNTTDYEAVMRELSLNRALTEAADLHYSTCYASEYATDCHSNFVTPRLPININRDIDGCPFGGDICVDPKDNEAARPIEMSTEWMSMQDLGINSKEKLRVQKSTTCALISLKKFCINCDDETEDYMHFVYGDPEYYSKPFYLNSTSAGGYRLTTSAWVPLAGPSIDPRLEQHDASVTILFFSAIKIFNDKPSTDPLYVTKDSVELGNVTWYLPRYYVQGLACTDKVRIRNDRNGEISPWGPPGLGFAYAPVYENAEALRLGTILGWASLRITVENIIAGRGAAALRATRFLHTYSQTNIAVNQTHEEIRAWFGTSIAKLQLMILSLGVGDIHYNTTGLKDFAEVYPYNGTGVDYSGFGEYVKFRDGRYTVISLAGMIVILVAGGILWIVSKSLELILPLEPRSKFSAPLQPATPPAPTTLTTTATLPHPMPMNTLVPNYTSGYQSLPQGLPYAHEPPPPPPPPLSDSYFQPQSDPNLQFHNPYLSPYSDSIAPSYSTSTQHLLPNRPSRASSRSRGESEYPRSHSPEIREIH